MAEKGWKYATAGALAATLLLLGVANAAVVQFDVAPDMTTEKWLDYTGASLARKVQVTGDTSGLTVTIRENKPGRAKVRIQATSRCLPGMRAVILTRPSGAGAYGFNVYVVHKGGITDVHASNSAVTRTQERVLKVREKTTAKFQIYGSNLGQWMKLVPQNNMQLHYGKGGFQQQARGNISVTDLVTDSRGVPVKAWHRGLRRAEVFTYIERYSPGTTIYVRGMDGLAKTEDGRFNHGMRVKLNVVADDSLPKRMSFPKPRSPNNNAQLGNVGQVELKWDPVTTTPVKDPAGKAFAARVTYVVHVRYVPVGSALNQVMAGRFRRLWKMPLLPPGIRGTTHPLRNIPVNHRVLWKVEARLRSSHDPEYGQIYCATSREFSFGTIE